MQTLSGTLATTGTTSGETVLWPLASTSTHVAYTKDWIHFDRWCKTHGCCPIPVSEETFQRYLSSLVLKDHRKFSTIRRSIAAISGVHLCNGLEGPLRHRNLRDLLRRIRLGSEPPRMTRPLLINDLQEIIQLMGNSNRDLRDRALLMVGFVAAMSRREIAELHLSQIRQEDEGIIVTLGDGRRSFIASGSSDLFCPVYSLNQWFGAIGVFGDPVFHQMRRGDHVQREGLSERSVSAIIKERVKSIGLDPSLYSGGSLRAGCIVEWIRRGYSLNDVVHQAGLKSLKSLRPYYEYAHNIGLNKIKAFKL